MSQTIAGHWQEINENIAALATKQQVTVVAVSKQQSTDKIKQAYQAGARYFGESYLQEALMKRAQLTDCADIIWCYLGRIQSNKIKKITEHFDWILSVTTLEMVERLGHYRHLSGKQPLNILLQVNISKESSKQGLLSWEAIDELADYVKQHASLNLRGLMAIGSQQDKAEEFKTMQGYFKKLAASYETVDTLSMGMSHDYPLAVQHGANQVRVGRSLFGERGKPR